MKKNQIKIAVSVLTLALLSGCSLFHKVIPSSEEKSDIQETVETKTEKTNDEQKVVYDRQDRIDAYQENNPNLSKEECIKRVYMNLDLEPYSQTTTVEDLDSYTMLVNKYSGLPSDYTPYDLVDINGGGMVREKVAEAFNELADACAQFDLSVTSWSAFRSYDTQYSLYHNGVANYGLEYAEIYWTHPGFSEHQTGLTIDVCLDYDRSDLDVARENPHYQEFLETLHEYGFILRYADDKTEYTQIAPESWHIRYVGKDLATYLYENNLCLDEYYGLVDAKLMEPIH